MGIVDKIGKYLKGFKVIINKIETYTSREKGVTEVEETWEVVIKKGNVVIAKKEVDSEKAGKKWADEYVEKYGNMGNIKEGKDIPLNSKTKRDDFVPKGYKLCPKCDGTDGPPCKKCNSDGYIKEEMDANHDDFFELGNLKRQLEALKKQRKGMTDTVLIDNKIKKVEDKIRYLRK